MKTRINQVVTEIIDVTPAMAQQWLNQNHAENRAINISRVAQYARSMRDHEWLPTGESIKFDVLDRLMDGQHRLLAVLKSGMTVPMFITRGLDPSVFHVIDHGYSRPTLWWAPKDHRATTMAMYVYPGGAAYRSASERPTESEAAEFYQKHYEAIAFAVGIMPNMRGVDARVRAAVARASYHIGRTLLMDFSGALYLHQVNPSARRQLTVMKLRDVLTDRQRDRRQHASAKSRYLKVEAALRAFAADKALKTLHEAKEELFPIPEDKVQLREASR